ncbi:hypothetical protein HQ576_05990, partial [bacterium]|nr:hypothetical protein [bacterium]
MRSDTKVRSSVMIAAVLAMGACDTVWAEAMPENLAPRAKVSASSQFSDEYR